MQQHLHASSIRILHVENVPKLLLELCSICEMQRMQETILRYITYMTRCEKTKNDQGTAARLKFIFFFTVIYSFSFLFS